MTVIPGRRNASPGWRPWTEHGPAPSRHNEKEEDVMKLTGTVLLLALILAGGAQAAPFAKGNPSHGKQLYDENCAACHARMFGGDGSTIFTRPGHKITSAAALAQQI